MEDLMRSMPRTDPGADSEADPAASVGASPGAPGRGEGTGSASVGLAPIPVDPMVHRRFADAQAAWPLRRLGAVAVLAPVLLVLSVVASGGWALVTSPGWTVIVLMIAVACATTVAMYLPRPGTGLKLDFGCTPCAAVAAVSVLASLGVLSSAPHEVPTAILALGIAGFGLRQRLTNPITCAPWRAAVPL